MRLTTRLKTSFLSVQVLVHKLYVCTKKASRLDRNSNSEEQILPCRILWEIRKVCPNLNASIHGLPCFVPSTD
jgi:hypothetical protein